MLKSQKKRFNIPKMVRYALPSFVIFFIVLLAYYPGILVSDSMVQWHQTQTGIFSDWHPAYNTIYIYLLTKIWNNPFWVLVVQSFILSVSLGAFLGKLEQYYKVNKYYLYVASIVFGLIPLNFNSAIILLKDTLYSAFILILSGQLLSIANNKEYINNKYNLIKLGSVCLIICLFRHNGILVVSLLLLILIILHYKKKSIYILSISVVGLYFAMTSIGFKIFNIEGGNIANTFGPLSHFNAKLLNEKNKFTEEELEELSLYVDVDKLKNTFNQYNMDNSINAQNVDYIKNHKKEYLLFTLKKICSNFLSFIEYYLKLDSYLYSVMPFDGQYTVGMFYETDLWVYEEQYSYLNENSKIPFLLQPLKDITIVYQKGILGIITMRPALYMYLSIIFIIIISIWEKNKMLWIVLLPGILNIISLAPAIPVAMTRYVYSMMLIFYVIFTLFVFMLVQKIKDRNNYKLLGGKNEKN